jgi:phage gp36-like protein
MVGSMSAVSSSTLATFGDDAEAEINVRLSKLYVVPVPGSPPALVSIATDLLVHRLLSRRTFTQERTKKSEWPDAFAKDAHELLDKLASGEATLVDSAGTLIAARTDVMEVWTNKQNYQPTFDEHGRYDQVQDPDKIDDLEDARDL